MIINPTKFSKQSVCVVSHPLIEDKLLKLRDEKTPSHRFAILLRQITSLMMFDALANIETKQASVRTPIAIEAKGKSVTSQVVVVPILRAGLGMIEGFSAIVDEASYGHIGIYRDPQTHLPKCYFAKLPHPVSNAEVFVLDPMLASGSSLIAALDELKSQGFKSISLMVIIATEVGIANVLKAHKNVKIFCAKIDPHLDANNYIFPGLGDAGDRLFQTPSMKQKPLKTK